MTDKTEKILASIDRPSFRDAVSSIIHMFAVHETKIADQQNQMNAFDKRIDTVKLGIFEDNSELASHVSSTITRMHERIDFLEDRMTGMEARVPGPINNTTPAALTRDLESLTAYVTRLETLINDIEKDMKERLNVHRTDIDALELRNDPARIDRLEALLNDIEKELKQSIAAGDRARARGDDAMQDLVTRTANSLYAEIKKLTDYVNGQDTKILDLEHSVDQLGLTPPAPQRDTSWHPHDAKTYETCPSFDDARIVVMRRDGVIQRPWKGTELYWDENGDDTIIAWRYAKEGE